MVEFWLTTSLLNLEDVFFVRSLGFQWEGICVPPPSPLADLFLYSYEYEFLENMIRSGHRKLARSFNLRYRYIDDLIVFSNKKFEDYVKEIYPSQLTVEKANTSDELANYLDLTFIKGPGSSVGRVLACESRGSRFDPGLRQLSVWVARIS